MSQCSLSSDILFDAASSGAGRAKWGSSYVKRKWESVFLLLLLLRSL